MPLPIGHTAIGLAVFETKQSSTTTHHSRLALFFWITLLANLPDLDVLFGLIMQGNGAAFHRGPTHSLLFALAAGCLASQMGRLWSCIPKLGPGLCSLLILSHVVADMWLTTSPVSLFWPLEIHWTQGHSGWGQIVDMVLFQGVQDAGIAVTALAYVFGLRAVRYAARGHSLFSLDRKRAK